MHQHANRLPAEYDGSRLTPSRGGFGTNQSSVAWQLHQLQLQVKGLKADLVRLRGPLGRSGRGRPPSYAEIVAQPAQFVSDHRAYQHVAMSQLQHQKGKWGGNKGFFPPHQTAMAFGDISQRRLDPLRHGCGAFRTFPPSPSKASKQLPNRGKWGKSGVSREPNHPQGCKGKQGVEGGDLTSQFCG